MAVDIFAQLWPASFKGVAFWTEKDDEDGGRHLAKSTFPYGNSWFVENLGPKITHYSVVAYLVDDAYLADASALGGACNGAGAGPLVLPAQGPVGNCHCEEFKRAREKDRTGHIAFDCKFVLDGAAMALQSVDYSAQLALDAVADAADAGIALASQIAVVAAPSWIAANVVDGLQTIAATLDTIRIGTGNVDPTQSQAIEGQLTALYNAIPAAVSVVTGIDTSIVPAMVAIAQTLAASMPAATAADAFGAAADAMAQPAAPDPSRTANAQQDAANAGILARLGRYVLLSAYLAGVVDATYTSRPQGIDAKVLLVHRFDSELALCFGAADEALYVALQTLRNAGVAYLETLITTLAPILTVTTGVSLPSLVLAYKLYPSDPDLGARARDLVLRNDVKHPSFMPTTFEALAPQAAV